MRPPRRRGRRRGRTTEAAATQFAPRADLATGEDQVAVAERVLAVQRPGAWPTVPYATVEDDPRHGAEVAATPSPDRMVLALPDGLRDALAATGDPRLAEVAADWARTEELADADPADLLDFLRRLGDLARTAGTAHLYAYVEFQRAGRPEWSAGRDARSTVPG